MTICTHPTALGKLPAHLDRFGLISGRQAYPLRLRFGDEGGDGTGAGGDGGEGGGEGGDDGDGDEQLGDAGVRAFERTKTELRERKGELKAWTDLGLTVDDVKALRDGQGGQGVDVAGIEQRVRATLQTEFDEQRSSDARASAVRELAATSGFVNPKQALRLIDDAELAKVAVKDGTADEAGVKKLLDDLAKESPYLLAPTDSTADARTAGIGASGAGTTSEPKPGTDRLRSAFASTGTK
jgi:hypothetical protein